MNARNTLILQSFTMTYSGFRRAQRLQPQSPQPVRIAEFCPHSNPETRLPTNFYRNLFLRTAHGIQPGQRKGFVCGYFFTQACNLTKRRPENAPNCPACARARVLIKYIPSALHTGTASWLFSIPPDGSYIAPHNQLSSTPRWYMRFSCAVKPAKAMNSSVPCL